MFDHCEVAIGVSEIIRGLLRSEHRKKVHDLEEELKAIVHMALVEDFEDSTGMCSASYTSGIPTTTPFILPSEVIVSEPPVVLKLAPTFQRGHSAEIPLSTTGPIDCTPAM